MKLVWNEDAWADCVLWQLQDRTTLKQINTLIRDIARNGNEGIGETGAPQTWLSRLLVEANQRGAPVGLSS
jgi:Txe/YoeB family toxin of Txe-Axe toxin-antitoxin module